MGSRVGVRVGRGWQQPRPLDTRNGWTVDPDTLTITVTAKGEHFKSVCGQIEHDCRWMWSSGPTPTHPVTLILPKLELVDILWWTRARQDFRHRVVIANVRSGVLVDLARCRLHQRLEVPVVVNGLLMTVGEAEAVSQWGRERHAKVVLEHRLTQTPQPRRYWQAPDGSCLMCGGNIQRERHHFTSVTTSREGARTLRHYWSYYTCCEHPPTIPQTLPYALGQERVETERTRRSRMAREARERRKKRWLLPDAWEVQGGRKHWWKQSYHLSGSLGKRQRAQLDADDAQYENLSMDLGQGGEGGPSDNLSTLGGSGKLSGLADGATGDASDFSADEEGADDPEDAEDDDPGDDDLSGGGEGAEDLSHVS